MRHVVFFTVIMLLVVLLFILGNVRDECEAESRGISGDSLFMYEKNIDECHLAFFDGILGVER